MAGPKVGEILFHHGRRHEILGFRGDKFWFRNGGFLGRGETADLRFSEGDGWWYLPGRVLANDERTVVNAMMGAWPSAASHLAMRKVLDVEGPLADHVGSSEPTANPTRRSTSGWRAMRWPVWRIVKNSARSAPARPILRCRRTTGRLPRSSSGEFPGVGRTR
jgi:hypothetical protein